ncbi:hypothetical protein ACHAWF_014653 [Thalassiosira exigua]
MLDEFCAITKTSSPAEEIARELDQELAKMTSSGPLTLKRGIKCPMAIWDSQGIEFLSEHFQDTKVVIGLRHPVAFFQSFYNYRVTEMYDNSDVEKPPSPLELIGSNKWRDVSTDLARYELSLMQLAKTPLWPEHLAELGSRLRRISPNPFKVFIYTMEQLNDKDERRANAFRSDLQQFLRLENPLEPFSKENINHVTHEESIDICEERFNPLRDVLVRQGNITAQWIRDQLLKSEDIYVGGRQRFVELISTWGNDPCKLVEQKRASESQGSTQ